MFISHKTTKNVHEASEALVNNCTITLCFGQQLQDSEEIECLSYEPTVNTAYEKKKKKKKTEVSLIDFNGLIAR